MAPSGRKSAGKPAKVAKKTTTDAAEKTKKKKPTRSYKTYIHRLMKKGSHGNKITTKGMVIVNSFVTDLFERLAAEASRLNAHAGTKTLSSAAVIAAVKLQLPSEMAKQALTQGAKAVGQYTKTMAAQQKSSGKKKSGKKASK
eukprot:TRINITY_DN352_c1_g2_i2.p2 TRINITY_DN352_c1_g2~~TRINITY_DN352_c1_g2_i2.p2  ORF type:complete len:162 (+),score=92.99 TRINITY_DN352_c1_g2_i2:58-486(+)